MCGGVEFSPEYSAFDFSVCIPEIFRLLGFQFSVIFVPLRLKLIFPKIWGGGERIRNMQPAEKRNEPKFLNLGLAERFYVEIFIFVKFLKSLCGSSRCRITPWIDWAKWTGLQICEKQKKCLWVILPIRGFRQRVRCVGKIRN